MDFMPPDSILGTTIETNRDYHISQAPNPRARVLGICDLLCPRMVSIEPIMDFDLDVLVAWINQINPDFVSIGADSKGHNLQEPSADKVDRLIQELSDFTEVKVKGNLKRLSQRVPAIH
jgi:hypothetical protein